MAPAMPVLPRGLLWMDVVNHDGETDTATISHQDFEQGMVVGRAKAWTEKDFSYDITGGVDFMGNVSAQVAEYKDTLDQKNPSFHPEGCFCHAHHRCQEQGVCGEAQHHDLCPMSATTLNSAVNKACGSQQLRCFWCSCTVMLPINLENRSQLEFMNRRTGTAFRRI